MSISGVAGSSFSPYASIAPTTATTVHKHIRSIFAKLALAPADHTDRRVVAVLKYLENS